MTLSTRTRHEHTALLYYSERECLDTLVRFVADGLDRAEPVLVAIPGVKLASLRAALGDVAGDVTMTDITDTGRNPGRVLAAQLAFVARHRHRHVRMIGELVWPGRTDVEYPACLQHEALVNVALAGLDVTGLCLFDGSAFDEDVLADVRRTHPLVWQGGSAAVSGDYSVDAALEQCNQPLSTDPVAVTCTVGEAPDLAGARSSATRYGRLLGMSADRIAELALIVTELATNSLDHADGTCRLAFWHHAGHLVCEARDRGHFADPLAGRRPPTPGGPYGLFVVNALADLVRIHTSAAGTTVHAYLRLDRPAGQTNGAAS
ncbi:sensor histidine kinase [Mycobacterium sp.]|uniref:sensor histidine kinase n=1 Tax=Mycobacterium sp. TaxID=1785 RepID=UPI0031D9C814